MTAAISTQQEKDFVENAGDVEKLDIPSRNAKEKERVWTPPKTQVAWTRSTTKAKARAKARPVPGSKAERQAKEKGSGGTAMDEANQDTERNIAKIKERGKDQMERAKAKAGQTQCTKTTGAGTNGGNMKLHGGRSHKKLRHKMEAQQ